MGITASQLELGTGLQIDGRALRVNLVMGNGLSGNGGANALSLNLEADSGLEFSGTAVRAKINASLLKDTAGGGLRVNLNNVLAFTANPTMNADPVGANDLTRKSYVDSVASGLDVKKSVAFASTANLSGTYTEAGGASARGQFTAMGNANIDGVTLVQGMRVLLKDQTAGAQNGIWVITTLGTGANGVWDRASDFDADAEVTPGAFTFIEQGGQADTGWVLSTDGTIVLGGASGTALVFTQFSSAGLIQAGNGLTKSGNVIDVVVGDGLAVNANDIQLALAANSGLAKSGGLTVVADPGGNLSIVVGANGIAVKRDGGKGLSLGADGLFVGIDTNRMEYSSGNVRAKLSADKGIVEDGTSGLQTQVNASKAMSVAAGGLGVLLSNNKGLVFDGTNGLALVTPGNGLLVNGASGALDVQLDQGTITKSGSGLRVGLASLAESEMADIFLARDAMISLDDAPVSTSGGRGVVFGGGAEGQVTELGTPGMAVRVQTGGTAINHKAKSINIPTTTSLAIAAADATNPRHDIIVVNAGQALAVRQGTPAGSPADPSLTTGDVVLARVIVAANDTAINTADIIDLRVRRTIQGSKIMDKSILAGRYGGNSIVLDDIGSALKSDYQNGTGATAYPLATRIAAAGWRGMGSVRVFVNGVRVKQVSSGPTGSDYTVTDNGSATTITFGTAPNGDALVFDYFA